MNIALVSAEPNDLACDKLVWVASALEQCGHHVRRIHHWSALSTADAECEALLFDHKAPVNHNNIAALGKTRRAVWVQWWRDLVDTMPGVPLEKQPNMIVYGKAMRVMDAVLVKERALLQDYARLGINARWFDQACPTEMPACEQCDNPQYDVLVLGSIAEYRQRYADVRTLVSAGFRVLWAGWPDSMTIPDGCESAPWHHPLKELPQLVSRCAVVLGVDYRTDVPGYTSDRTHLVAGMGGCLISRVADYGDGTVGSTPAAQLSAWIYDCPESLANVVRTAVNNPQERMTRGEQSRRLVMSQHTYDHRATELSEIIGELQGERVVQSAGEVH